MRKFLLLLSPLLFIMCSNGITDKDEYEVKLTVQINPPLKAGMSPTGLYTWCGLETDHHSLFWTSVNQTDDLGFLESDLALVPDGNFQIAFTILGQHDSICRDVTLETIVDGNVFDTKTGSIGGASAFWLSCTDAYGLGGNLILP